MFSRERFSELVRQNVEVSVRCDQALPPAEFASSSTFSGFDSRRLLLCRHLTTLFACAPLPSAGIRTTLEWLDVFVTDDPQPSLDADLAAPEAVVYWRPGCGFCSMLRAGLDRSGTPYREVNIWDDPEAAAFVRSVARGNETVPTVTVGSISLVNPTAGEVAALLAGASR